MQNTEYLVFKGGGVLGIAYAGAIEALDEKQILTNIKGAAGTSAGSITAALVCLGYSASELKTVINDTNFKDFEDHWDPLRLATKYGLYKGDALLDWIKNVIKQKTNNENITYAEMHAANFRDLRVFATDLNLGNVQEFSYRATPDAIVAESIRASMSIPLFFAAWKFSNSVPNNHIYVDGGMLFNYPITAFESLSGVLGFFLRGHAMPANNLNFDHPLAYVKQLFTTVLKAQNVNLSRDEIEEAVTVNIDDLNISSIDFGLSQAQKTALFDSGKKATLEYISANGLIQ